MKYRVLPGHAFDMGGGVTADAGAEIELADDVAAMHRHRIEPIPDDTVQTPARDADPGFDQET